jgi:DNA-binding transcriptional regulator YiaG
MKKKYHSEILQMVYEEAVANFKVGVISEERMRHYKKECLVSEAAAPQKLIQSAASINVGPMPALASQY